jgi:preprotein translocase subunit SecA
VAENLVETHKPAEDAESLNLDCIRNFGIEAPFDEKELKSESEDSLVNKLFIAAQKHYQEKVQAIAGQAFPVVKDVYQNPGNTFENMVIPFTDGLRGMQVLVNLRKAFDTKGREITLSFEKGVVLSMIDDAWKEHLRELDDLKQAVQNASLEQKDPLVIYKLESFNLFREMMMRSNKDIISFLMQGGLPKEEVNANGRPQQQTRFTQEAPRQKKERLRESREVEEAPADVAQKPRQEPVRVGARVGRNDPCPCGSGKKYKNCHGAGA